jgi:inosose dehydratase
MPWQRFLDEVAEVGYEWIELGPYGYLPTDLPTLREALEVRRLKVCACIVEGNLEDAAHWPDVEAQVLGGGELAAALDARFMVLIDDGYTDLVTGDAIAPKRLDEDGWKRLIDTTNRIAETARDRFGLRLLFHPNTETHVEYEDQIEALLAQTDPELVGLCLDLGHHAYCHGDPIAFMRRHHQRLEHVHFKNVDAEVLQRVERDGISVGQASGMDVFCALEDGVVDYEAVRDVLRAVDYNGFAIVEHDMFPAPFDKPLPIARRALAYLEEIGIGG